MELKESFAAEGESSQSLDAEGNFIEDGEKPQRIRTEGQRVTATPVHRSGDLKSRLYLIDEQAPELLNKMMPFTLDKDDQTLRLFYHEASDKFWQL